MTVLGRFAPSPTGILHLGNLRTALASWLSARAQGGRWIIRMEDVDGPRCRRDWGLQQLRDLAVLGLTSDVPVVWQSERLGRYRDALARFRAQGRLYTCGCTRKELALLASAPHAEDGLRPYPGTCRDQDREGAAALRVRLPKGQVAWQDRVQGAQSADPNEVTGDPLVFRRDGCFAYHLAVVVDDGDQGVTEVVRGQDLLPVTPTQIRLQEALDLPRPTYAHVGLVMASDGQRLGKRAGALGLEALLARGQALEDLVGWLGWSLGCLEAPRACTAADLVASFDWSKVPKGAVRLPGGW